MRILIILCVCLCYALTTPAQEAERSAEILILGLIHSGNQKFNHRTLYQTLEKIKPDLILWEQSEDFERVFGLLTAHRLKIAKPGIEQLALQKYARRNRHIGIFGFDTLIVSRKNYIKDVTNINRQFYDGLSKSRMSVEDSTTFAGYISLENKYYELFFSGSLVEINRPEVYENAGILYALDQNTLLPLAKKHLTDTALIQAFEQDHTFWIARNDFMVKQIKKYAKQYPGRRMVVLTGLNHKYYLMDKLSVQQEVPVKLMHLSYN